MDLEKMMLASQILAAELVKYFPEEAIAIELCPASSWKQAAWGIASGYPVDQCVASVIEAGQRNAGILEGDTLEHIAKHVASLTNDQVRKAYENTLCDIQKVATLCFEAGVNNARTGSKGAGIRIQKIEIENPDKTENKGDG